MFDAFRDRLGIDQGRLDPVGHETTSGSFAFVLGSDTAGRVVRLKPDDYAEVKQTGDLAGAGLLSLVGALRSPDNMPAGATWVLELRIAGVLASSVPLPHGVFDPSTIDAGDVGANISQAGADPNEIALRLRLDAPGTDAIDVELPGVYLDEVELLAAPGALYLLNRVPSPAQDDVPEDLPSLRLEIADTTGAGIAQAGTQIYVEGVLAYDGGAGGFQTGFDGPLSSASFVDGLGAGDATLVVDLSTQTFTHLQSVDIRVVAANIGGAENIDETYSFEIEDLQLPQVTAAIARNKTTVRVSFNEPVSMSTSIGGALHAESYTFVPTTLPAYLPTAVSVLQVSPSAVDVTLDDALTINAGYELTVTGVTDVNGNLVDPSLSTAIFTGFVPPIPAGRRFRHWDWVPEVNRREDMARGGPLRRTLDSFQDLTDQKLCEIDTWTEILDIDTTPFIDAMLADQGNPFPFAAELSNIDKRRLASVLVDMYKQKGTARGIINAIRFFLGIEVTIDVPAKTNMFILDQSLLDGPDKLAPASGDPLWYSFRIISPVVLTEDQEDKMLRIAKYTKAAWEHILGVSQPGDIAPSVSSFILDDSVLDGTDLLA